MSNNPTHPYLLETPMRFLVKNVDDLVRFKEISESHREAVDNCIIDVWCRCFTTDDIDKAVEEGDEYIIGKAIEAHKWYNDTSLDPRTGKRNSEKISIVPRFASSSFTRRYALSRFYEIDELLLGSSLVDVMATCNLVKACEYANYDKVRFLLTKGCD